MNHYFVYVTTADEEEAKTLAHTLVRERLAACANLLGEIESVYWWDGEVNTGKEQALVLKTTGEQVESLVQRAVELHSYDCPCVVALPIEAGHPGFLHWLSEETRPGRQDARRR